ncbi:MAG: rod-binding protein [Clostridiales bacterium]|jgi:flagellar protein FlgJ|nr:rod-binding protein [Clostridiales bacterium]
MADIVSQSIGGAGGIGGAQLSAAASTADAQALASAAKDDDFESKLRSAMTAENEKELKDACVQFEELMLGILYKSMKATVQRAEIAPADPGRETFEQWQDDALMKKIAENGSFGLANMMYAQLSKRMKNAYDLADETAAE